MVRHRTTVIAAVIIMLGGLLAIYSFVSSHVAADRYLGQLNIEANRLEQSYNELAKSSSQTLFSAPDILPEERLEQINQSRETLQKAQDQLDSFREKHRQLGLDKYVISGGQYAKARSASQHADGMYSQSQEVLRNYRELLDYLAAVDKTRIVFESNTKTINKITNFDTYVGRDASVRAMGVQIQESLVNLSKISAPKGLEEAHASMIKTFNTAASGFDMLARGLRATADDQIASGVQKIEAATTVYEATDLNMLYDSIVEGAVLKDLETLPEKLEPLMQEVYE